MTCDTFVICLLFVLQSANFERLSVSQMRDISFTHYLPGLQAQPNPPLPEAWFDLVLFYTVSFNLPEFSILKSYIVFSTNMWIN